MRDYHTNEGLNRYSIEWLKDLERERFEEREIKGVRESQIERGWVRERGNCREIELERAGEGEMGWEELGIVHIW